MKKLLFIAVAAIAVSCGNKQQAQQPESDSTAVTTDTVTQQVESQVDQQAAIDAKVSANIQEFYKNYVFGREELTDEAVNKYCTKRLAKKLADDYEYEGGGYAIWDFRSGDQDGDETKVLNVEALGDGKYKVVMDGNSSRTISVIIDGDNVFFDEIK